MDNEEKEKKARFLMKAIGPAMMLVDGWTKDITPQNEVAEFLEKNIGILFKMLDPSEIDGITPLIGKLMVFQANENPVFMERKLLGFYEQFRLFYRDLTEKRQKDAAQ